MKPEYIMALIAIEDDGDRLFWTTDGQRVHTAASLTAIVRRLHEPRIGVLK
jgi:hypothetical protein